VSEVCFGAVRSAALPTPPRWTSASPARAGPSKRSQVCFALPFQLFELVANGAHCRRKFRIAGSSFCASCVPGKFNTIDASGSCLTCPSGNIMALQSPAAASLLAESVFWLLLCRLVPELDGPGQLQAVRVWLSRGRWLCQLCSLPGTLSQYRSVYSLLQLTRPCFFFFARHLQAGMFASQPSSVVCKLCNIGSFSDVPGSSACAGSLCCFSFPQILPILDPCGADIAFVFHACSVRAWTLPAGASGLHLVSNNPLICEMKLCGSGSSHFSSVVFLQLPLRTRQDHTVEWLRLVLRVSGMAAASTSHRRCSLLKLLSRARCF
jgi:hypothetical protein